MDEHHEWPLLTRLRTMSKRGWTITVLAGLVVAYLLWQEVRSDARAPQGTLPKQERVVSVGTEEARKDAAFVEIQRQNTEFKQSNDQIKQENRELKESLTKDVEQRRLEDKRRDEQFEKRLADNQAQLLALLKAAKDTGAARRTSTTTP